MYQVGHCAQLEEAELFLTAAASRWHHIITTVTNTMVTRDGTRLTPLPTCHTARTPQVPVVWTYTSTYIYTHLFTTHITTLTYFQIYTLFCQCVCLKVFRCYQMDGAPPLLVQPPPPLPLCPRPPPLPWPATLPPHHRCLTTPGLTPPVAFSGKFYSKSQSVFFVTYILYKYECVCSVSIPACGRLDAVS